jgi:hypothetical protein
MKWILIWAIYNFGAGSTEFDSAQSCEVAMSTLKRAATLVVAVCVQK